MNRRDFLLKSVGTTTSAMVAPVGLNILQTRKRPEFEMTWYKTTMKEASSNA